MGNDVGYDPRVPTEFAFHDILSLSRNGVEYDILSLMTWPAEGAEPRQGTQQRIPPNGLRPFPRTGPRWSNRDQVQHYAN